MEDKLVKMRIKPLHGIGGYGEAGDVVMMPRELAEMYARDGFVEFVEESDQPSAVSDQQPVVEEDHKIMKPRSKRK